MRGTVGGMSERIGEGAMHYPYLNNLKRPIFHEGVWEPVRVLPRLKDRSIKIATPEWEKTPRPESLNMKEKKDLAQIGLGPRFIGGGGRN